MTNDTGRIKPRFQEAIRGALLIRSESLPADSILSPAPSADILDVTEIPRSCGLLSEWELEITDNYDATTLCQGLAAQKFTASAVLSAFRKRASIAQQLVRKRSSPKPSISIALTSRVDQLPDRTSS